MPDVRSTLAKTIVGRSQIHRGVAPEDDELLDPRHWPSLRLALADLRWLLDRGYAMPSSIELVGNRHLLTARQRMAVTRCACSTEALRLRQARQVQPQDVQGQELWLDGFNVLTALEVALAGGVVLRGCDGCCRDVAGVHARYRKVEETAPSLKLIGELLLEWGVSGVVWWLDQPVSNSGRLKTTILDSSARHEWNWKVELVYNPDKVLAQSDRIIATADSAILDRCQRWINLAGLAIAWRVPNARLVDFTA